MKRKSKSGLMQTRQTKYFPCTNVLLLVQNSSTLWFQLQTWKMMQTFSQDRSNQNAFGIIQASSNRYSASSICMSNSWCNILLFDGQHKAAAQVWLGRPAIECKVYIEPDQRKLRETNLSAHEKLRQMPFYTSTLIAKYRQVFGMTGRSMLNFQGQSLKRNLSSFLLAAKGKAGVKQSKRSEWHSSTTPYMVMILRTRFLSS